MCRSFFNSFLPSQCDSRLDPPTSTIAAKKVMETPRSHLWSKTTTWSTQLWMARPIKFLDLRPRSVVSFIKVWSSYCIISLGILLSFPIEHLGLIVPQPSQDRDPEITAAMHPAPYPNKDETHTHEDRLVADPISDEVDVWWKEAARKNREIFTELFRPLPTNLVRDWPAYDVCILHLPLLRQSSIVFSS